MFRVLMSIPSFVLTDRSDAPEFIDRILAADLPTGSLVMESGGVNHTVWYMANFDRAVRLRARIIDLHIPRLECSVREVLPKETY